MAMNKKIVEHRDLEVCRKAFDAAMRVFEQTRLFPKDETYSLTDQIRRSSRSICTNMAEGWRKRRYEAAFVAKLSDAESEAAETQVWLEFAVKCGYLNRELALPLYALYVEVIRMFVAMANRPNVWTLGHKRR